MPNVFISHSSHDKPFVKRLASALLTRGFPVWLDSWSMELGDSLLNSIYEGIDHSGCVILVLSHNSLASGWVNKELNAALSKEDQIGRKFLIPIKLDDCVVPLKIADRLYANFSSSFSEPFAQVAKVLERQHADQLPVAPERELLAISFTREVHLDRSSYSKNLASIRKRQRTLKLTSDQIVVADDAEIGILQRRLYGRLDDFANDPFYSPRLESFLRAMADRVATHQNYLSEGLALLANLGYSETSAYWFAKICRGRIVYALWTSQRPDLTDPLEYGNTWICADLNTSTEAATFFETDGVKSVDLWRSGEGPNKAFHFWLPQEVKDKLVSAYGWYGGPDSGPDVLPYSDQLKYAIPQMVLQHLSDGTPLIKDLDDALVGLT